MLWSKRGSQVDAGSIATKSQVSDADKALDTVATFLRTYGEHAFDTDEFEADELKERCEAWASRILVGPVQASEESRGTSGASVRRDWAGVRRFLKENREIEGGYVARSMGNLRQAIRSFAQCLGSAVGEDKASDKHVETSLGELTRALSDSDTERIRQEATQVVRTVRQAISVRRQRERKQLAFLGERLQSLRGELTQAKAQASSDALTGLSNRAAFDEHLERLADLGLLFGHPPCLLMIDVDHFKQVNDTYGHPAGDEVLKEVANCITRAFLRKQDFVARYGGEEFAVLVVDTEPQGAKMLATRCVNGLRDAVVEYQGNEISVTMSIGAASLVPGEGAVAWLERADRALYSAKKAGRDRVVLAE